MSDPTAPKLRRRLAALLRLEGAILHRLRTVRAQIAEADGALKKLEGSPKRSVTTAAGDVPGMKANEWEARHADRLAEKTAEAMSPAHYSKRKQAKQLKQIKRLREAA